MSIWQSRSVQTFQQSYSKDGEFSRRLPEEGTWLGFARTRIRYELALRSSVSIWSQEYVRPVQAGNTFWMDRLQQTFPKAV